jgi:hypothetical protein
VNSSFNHLSVRHSCIMFHGPSLRIHILSDEPPSATNKPYPPHHEASVQAISVFSHVENFPSVRVLVLASVNVLHRVVKLSPSLFAFSVDAFLATVRVVLTSLLLALDVAVAVVPAVEEAVLAFLVEKSANLPTINLINLRFKVSLIDVF